MGKTIAIVILSVALAATFTWLLIEIDRRKKLQDKVPYGATGRQMGYCVKKTDTNGNPYYTINGVEVPVEDCRHIKSN